MDKDLTSIEGQFYVVKNHNDNRERSWQNVANDQRRFLASDKLYCSRIYVHHSIVGDTITLGIFVAHCDLSGQIAHPAKDKLPAD